MTLVELMVGILIATFMLVAGAPFFGDYVRNARLREAGNALLTEALMAQSEAIKRNGTVRLSVSGSTVQVIDRSTGGADVVLRDRTLPNSVGAAAATLDFGAEGRPLPFGTSGSVDLTLSGVSCNSEMRCPGLRIDAGGAVRLCGNHLSSCY